MKKKYIAPSCLDYIFASQEFITSSIIKETVETKAPDSGEVIVLPGTPSTGWEPEPTTDPDDPENPYIEID